LTGTLRTYRDSVAWRKGMDTAKAVYKLTATFPADERFGLVSQMRRAAVSIPSNIAEGFGRGRGVDNRRFLRMARGSVFELETQLELAGELGFGSSQLMAETRTLVEECGRVLAGLMRKLEQDDEPVRRS